MDETRPQVAVEFDLYSDSAQATKILRLCNYGPLFSIHVPSENYEDRLITPILLGMAVSVQAYGQPLRALSNQGEIVFKLDETYSAFIFSDDLHWVGRAFRVYQGIPTGRGFVEDLDLVFHGHVQNVTHDTVQATIRTSDSSIHLDKPLVSDFYPATALPGIAGKPRPQIWGTVFCIEPILEDNLNFVYRLSRTPVIDVIDFRVGGIPWERTMTFPPGSAQWYLDAVNATVTLGSITLGLDVRCDVIGTTVRGIGELATAIVSGFGLAVDFEALNAIDNDRTLAPGYFSSTNPINVLSVMDDIFTGAGCWWGIQLDLLTGGFIGAPTAKADIVTVLDRTNIKSLSLSQLIPPAWRVPVEYERHWQPEQQFSDAVDENVKQRWSAEGLKVIVENSSLLVAEPMAFDVPTVRSVLTDLDDANYIAGIFARAWETRRFVLDIEAQMDSTDIMLYNTITVDYMMYSKNFRIISAAASFGGGAAQLQLWG